MPNIKLLVAVPAYNCSSQISRVIKQFANSSFGVFAELLIIDNRSSDNTLQAAKQSSELYEDKKISIIQNDENYSLGGTHKVAFQYALEKNYDGVVILHGDDQGRLADMEAFLDSNNLAKFDCILGARFMKGSNLIGYGQVRILGNYVFNALYSICTGQKVFDMGSGLNYFSKRLISERIHSKMPDDLTFNNAFLLAVIAAGKKVQFIPISWREEDQISNAKLWSQSIKLFKYLTQYLINNKKYLNTDFRPLKRDVYTSKKIK